MPRARLDRSFESRLSGLVNARERGVLQGGLKGVEREALRVRPDGRISQAPHPLALGSALTHPHITTDYSEALIELVTPPFPSSWELQQYLCEIHQFVYSELGDELLWATSMPCAINKDSDIPIAEYGTSNIGRMKHVYRLGLGSMTPPAVVAVLGTFLVVGAAGDAGQADATSPTVFAYIVATAAIWPGTGILLITRGRTS